MSQNNVQDSIGSMSVEPAQRPVPGNGEGPRVSSATTARQPEVAVNTASPLGENAVQETIAEPERRKRVVRALFNSQAWGLVRKSGQDLRSIRTARLRWETEFPLYFEGRGSWPKPPFTIELLGYNSIYCFFVSETRKAEGLMAVPMPDRLVRVRHREQRRVLTSGMGLWFKHPTRPEHMVRHDIRDVSYDGLSFYAEDDDLLFRDRQLTEIAVERDGKIILKTGATVRHVTQDCRPQTRGAPLKNVCGLQLDETSDGDRTHWLRAANRFLHPHTRAGATWSEHLWDVYNKSGYFGLSGKSPAHFIILKESFTNSSRKLDAAPHIGCQSVWPANGGIEATVSLLRLWSGTCVGYHMAKRKKSIVGGVPGKQVLREIHSLAYETMYRVPGLRWIIGYLQHESRWTRLVHYELPRRYIKQGRACIVPFQAIEISCSSLAHYRSRDITIDPATADETNEICTILKKSWPLPYIDSLDLAPARFDLKETRDDWKKCGFERERAVFAARRSGDLVAAAVMEIAEKGLHLFNLFDTVRLYALCEGGEAAFEALLDNARRWYSSRNRESFIYLAEIEKPMENTMVYCRNLGSGDMTILSAELLPELLEHLFEVTH